jgi:hypothetical protein
MIKIHKLKYSDRTITKDDKEWYLSVSHQVDNKEDLDMFLSLFLQTISEHFELEVNKPAIKKMLDNYIYGQECILTFNYPDLSIALSTLSNINSNLFKFNYN